MTFVRTVAATVWAASFTFVMAQTSEWTQAIDQADTLEQRGYYKEAIVLYESAVRLAGNANSPDLHLPLTLVKLGLAYEQAGRFPDAIRAYNRSLVWVERVKGRNTLEYAALLSNLAAANLEMGQDAKAEPLVREALAIYEAALKSQDARLVKARSVLADLLIKRADYREAEPLLEGTIRFFESRPDAKRELGIARNNLGVVRRFQKRYEESRVLLESAVAATEADADSSHPALARVLDNLAMTYADLGLRDQADATFRRSIEIGETRMGPEHPVFAAMLRDYAVFLRKNGRKHEAKVFQARSRKVFQESARRNAGGMTVDVSAFRSK